MSQAAINRGTQNSSGKCPISLTESAESTLPPSVRSTECIGNSSRVDRNSYQVNSCCVQASYYHITNQRKWRALQTPSPQIKHRANGHQRHSSRHLVPAITDRGTGRGKSTRGEGRRRQVICQRPRSDDSLGSANSREQLRKAFLQFNTLDISWVQDVPPA